MKNQSVHKGIEFRICGYIAGYKAGYKVGF